MGSAGGDSGSGEGAVYSFFRNLRSAFGIPHRLEPGDKNRREKALAQAASQDMYDDTGYADPHSFVQEYENRDNNPNNDANQNTRSPPRRGMFPFGGGGLSEDNDGFDPLGFGSLFGQMEKLFSEMEKAMEDMNKQFEGFGDPESGDNRPDRFGLFNDPIIDRDELSKDGEDGERNRLIPYRQPNLRDEVLKPGNDDDGPGGSLSTDDQADPNGTKVQPRQFFSWGSNSTTIYSGGSKAYSQTIRDTPDGREITTFRQNPDGTTEKSTEFVPRKDIPTHGGLALPEPFGFIREFFRPRM